MDKPARRRCELQAGPARAGRGRLRWLPDPGTKRRRQSLSDRPVRTNRPYSHHVTNSQQGGRQIENYLKMARKFVPDGQSAAKKPVISQNLPKITPAFLANFGLKRVF